MPYLWCHQYLNEHPSKSLGTRDTGLSASPDLMPTNFGVWSIAEAAAFIKLANSREDRNQEDKESLGREVSQEAECCSSPALESFHHRQWRTL